MFQKIITCKIVYGFDENALPIYKENLPLNAAEIFKTVRTV